jgi:hypothetical protein
MISGAGLFLMQQRRSCRGSRDFRHSFSSPWRR